MISEKTIALIQIVVSVLVIIFILVGRSQSEGIEGALGGGASEMKTFSRRRGSEKIIFIITVLLVIIFALTAVLALVLQ